MDTGDDWLMSLVNLISRDIDNLSQDDEDTTTQSLKCIVQYQINKFPTFVIPIHSIKELYTYHTQIGRGGSSSVFMVQCNQTYQHHALKQMLRFDKYVHAKLNHFSFVHEIKILKELNHPHIVHFYDAYISNQYYYITTEYCSGGTLRERLTMTKRLSEKDSANVIKRILDAVYYMHKKNIVHRDLKLSNIVLDNADMEYSKLKLIDFGQSEVITNIKKRDRTIVGSLHYLPPETLRRRNKRDLFAQDMWAIGVIAYVLIEGVFPFNGKDLKSMRSIDKSPLKWNDTIPISNSCKEFIQSLLSKDRNKRLNAKQAMEHSWFETQISANDAVILNSKINKHQILSDTKTSRKCNIAELDTLEWSDAVLKDIDIESILSEIYSDTARYSENEPTSSISSTEPHIAYDDSESTSNNYI